MVPVQGGVPQGYLLSSIQLSKATGDVGVNVRYQVLPLRYSVEQE